MPIKKKRLSGTEQIDKILGGRLSLNQCIAAIRACEEVSQVEFAKSLGISRQHLCDIEHDRKTISPSLAAKYARILGHSEQVFVNSCLQDILDRAGLKFKVRLEKDCAQSRQKKRDAASG